MVCNIMNWSCHLPAQEIILLHFMTKPNNACYFKIWSLFAVYVSRFNGLLWYNQDYISKFKDNTIIINCNNLYKKIEVLLQLYISNMRNDFNYNVMVDYY